MYCHLPAMTSELSGDDNLTYQIKDLLESSPWLWENKLILPTIGATQVCVPTFFNLGLHKNSEVNKKSNCLRPWPRFNIRRKGRGLMSFNFEDLKGEHTLEFRKNKVLWNFSLNVCLVECNQINYYLTKFSKILFYIMISFFSF